MTVLAGEWDGTEQRDHLSTTNDVAEEHESGTASQPALPLRWRLSDSGRGGRTHSGESAVQWRMHCATHSPMLPLAQLLTDQTNLSNDLH